jgi:hypothetical protein
LMIFIYFFIKILSICYFILKYPCFHHTNFMKSVAPLEFCKVRGPLWFPSCNLNGIVSSNLVLVPCGNPGKNGLSAHPLAWEKWPPADLRNLMPSCHHDVSDDYTAFNC